MNNARRLEVNLHVLKLTHDSGPCLAGVFVSGAGSGFWLPKQRKREGRSLAALLFPLAERESCGSQGRGPAGGTFITTPGRVVARHGTAWFPLSCFRLKANQAGSAIVPAESRARPRVSAEPSNGSWSVERRSLPEALRASASTFYCTEAFEDGWHRINAVRRRSVVQLEWASQRYEEEEEEGQWERASGRYEEEKEGGAMGEGIRAL
ncbi:unnamed protein product [Lampetra planeri]